MPTSSKKSIGTDLSAVLEGLIKADVEFILVGGLAAVVQGAPVTTKDRQRLPILEETLRQLQEAYAFGLAAGKTVEKNEDDT